MTKSIFPNQIDSIDVDVSEALIAIENNLGTNANGSEFSTVSDRLNAIDKQIRLLSDKPDNNLDNLNLETILSFGNNTGGNDIVLGPGDCISCSDKIINLKGDVSINGGLEIFGYFDLNNHGINHLLLPAEPHQATNKQYVDAKISEQNNKLESELNNIKKSKADLFPEPEGNKYLKRNIENTGWEYNEINIQEIHNKFNELSILINKVSKNNTAGNDITVDVGDAIRSAEEGGFVNIDSNVMIHKKLVINGDIDLQSHHVISSLPPIRKTDLTNKQYVDTKIPTNLDIENQIIGSMLYFDGKVWITLNPGEENDVLMMKNNIPVWSKISNNLV